MSTIPEKILVEKSAPIPDRTRRNATSITTTIRSMEIGDSFVWPTKIKASGSIHIMFRTVGYKCATRITDNGHYRVWRTA